MNLKSSARLDILKASLVKKEAVRDRKINDHFEAVKQTNGQPLNDKRDGRKTFAKWDKQNDAIRAINESIERTKRAIEREISALNRVDSVQLPDFIQRAIADNKITQWRKFPNRFFVVGVEKGRLILEGGILKHSYLSNIPNDQYAKFRDTFNGLNAEARKLKGES